MCPLYILLVETPKPKEKTTGNICSLDMKFKNKSDRITPQLKERLLETSQKGNIE